MTKYLVNELEGTDKWIQVTALTTEPINYQCQTFRADPEELDRARKRFVGIPVYLNHQTVDENFLGTVTDSFFTDNKILLRINLLSKTDLQREVLSKIKSGEIKNVSLSFKSDDIPYQNEMIMTDIVPKEVSVLYNWTPYCPSCEIFEKNFAIPEASDEMSKLETSNAIYLVPPHGQMIVRGDKTLIVKARNYQSMVGKKLFLVSGTWCYGTIVLKKPFGMDLKKFRSLRNRHQITEKERLKWWKGKRTLFGYPFQISIWPKPKKAKMKKGVQTFGRVVFEENLISDIEKYHPEKLPIKVLHDDFRIALAWWSTKRRGGNIRLTQKQIEEVFEKILRELLKRNKEGRKGQITEFHPEKMKKNSRELFEKTMKKILGTKHSDEMELSSKPDTLKQPNIFAEVTPSDDHQKGDVIRLEDFEHDWDKPIKLIEDFVTIIGGVTNYEKEGTTGDVDILLKMPKNSFLDVPTKFRLFRAIKNRDIANRLHFLYDDFKGPFTSHKHKYDLVLVPKLEEQVHKMGEQTPELDLESEIKGYIGDMVPFDDETFGKPKIRTDNPKAVQDAMDSEKENKIKPFRFFYQMKPIHGRQPEEFYNYENLIRVLNKEVPDWKEKGVYVERKGDGQTAQVHKKGNQVRIWIEDGGEVTHNLPTLVNEISKMKNDFVVLGELELWEDGKKQPRAESNGILHKKELDPREKGIRLAVYDILWYNGKDIHSMDYEEREDLYRNLPQSEHFWINPSWVVSNEKQLKKFLERARKSKFSEGAIIKSSDFKYNLSLKPDKKFIKFKNEFSLIAKVLGKHKVKGAEKTYFYYCGIKDEKGNDIFVGRTFNTNISRNIGDKIRVIFADISKYYDPDKKTVWFNWWSPRCDDEDVSNKSFSTVKEATKLVEKTTGRIEEKKLPKMEEIKVKPEGVLNEKEFGDPYMEIPDEKGNYKYIIHSHWRGKSNHKDLRLEINNYNAGWTLDDSIKGKVTEPVLTMSDAKKWDSKPIWKIDWRKGEMRKTRTKTGKLVNLKIVCQTKPLHPKEWMTFEGVVPKGKVGATKDFPGVFHIIDKGRVQFGAQKPAYHEYFLSEGKLRGTLSFRLLKNIWKMKPPKDTEILKQYMKYPEMYLIDENEGLQSLWVPVENLEENSEDAPKTGRGEFVWFAMLEKKENLPYVLSDRAVKKGWIPPLGKSALPCEIRQRIPPEFHYWGKKASNLSDARRIRDELVSLIKKREVEIKLSAQTFPFILQRHAFKGQYVIRSGFGRQHWDLRIRNKPYQILHFVLNKNPITTKNVVAILKICKDMSSMDVGKKGIVRFEPGSPWNPTKDTPAFVEALCWGDVDVLEDSSSFKKFNFHSKKLKGVYTAIREGKTDLWVFSKSSTVGEKEFARMRVHGCAIRSGVLNGVYYPPEVIEKAKKSLMNREITIDHNEIDENGNVSIRDIVGRTTRVHYRKGALFFDGIVFDDQIAEQIKHKLIRGCSVRMRVYKNPEGSIANRIEFINVSLVINPACKETGIMVKK